MKNTFNIKLTFDDKDIDWSSTPRFLDWLNSSLEGGNLQAESVKDLNRKPEELYIDIFISKEGAE